MKIYLEADTTNGITAFASPDPDMKFIAAQDFADRLDGLGDDETIRTVVDSEEAPIYQKLAADYGIH